MSARPIDLHRCCVAAFVNEHAQEDQPVLMSPTRLEGIVGCWLYQIGDVGHFGYGRRIRRCRGGGRRWGRRLRCAHCNGCVRRSKATTTSGGGTNTRCRCARFGCWKSGRWGCLSSCSRKVTCTDGAEVGVLMTPLVTSSATSPRWAIRMPAPIRFRSDQSRWRYSGLSAGDCRHQPDRGRPGSGHGVPAQRDGPQEPGGRS
jgi:hypothetical protein